MKRIVTLGELMVRLTAPGYQRFRQSVPGTLETTFGGAEASVAALIAGLGSKSAYITAFPNNPLGHAALSCLKSLDVDTQHIVQADDGRMGLYFVETGANQRPGQVIYDREHSAFSATPSERYDWENIFAEATWLYLSGITPAISKCTAEVAKVAIAEARKRNVKVACDMNYRSKLWKWEPGTPPEQLAARTMRALIQQVDLLICSRNDIVITLGIPNGISNLALLRELCRQNPSLNTVAMTHRKSISANHQRFSATLYLPSSQKQHEAPVEQPYYDIPQAVDRIGTGDAFAGALLYALEDAELSDPTNAISFSTAAGCLAHSIPGDFSLITRQEVESLMRGQDSGRIQR
ncbi:sugar kinase [Calycomorphotria hydatis]|uniref:2-dehydro-3-deoxygluconokinase n=1 Tax=Calycomorphotria hydatis TaxID=2528027 RepID=A0A517T677_9PLAN|nr:sugar kinase [Calycomorphotria hydatis]QDT63887.1 2-dehydro-3-deoxygluconokinase [Calycomorphotria hydatis]